MFPEERLERAEPSALPVLQVQARKNAVGFMIWALAALPLMGIDFEDPNADREAMPTVPPGFEITIFAREPLVRQPCSMAFDLRGRLCVGMGPQYRNPTPKTPGDSVVWVLDTDGDGKADQTKVFATGFNAIQGLAWHGRDLWVANAPDLTLVRDLDGDDEADEYVRLYTDLGNLEHGLHGLNWAPDGKLYMSKGNSKGLSQPGRIAPKAFRDLWGVTAPPGSPDHPAARTFAKGHYEKNYHDPEDDWGREGGVLRCDPDGRNLEIVSRGSRNPWDITFDTGFHWLGTDNDQTSGDRVFMPFPRAHFGWNHPWSAHWGTEPHAPSAPVSGPLFEGSGTGIVFGDSAAFPASHRGVFFINDWLRKTTFVWRPRWEGALMRPDGGDWHPFIEGGRALFRPTDLEFGPDGALWVLGWGRGYGAEYRDGKFVSEGRVFRIAPAHAGRSSRVTPPPDNPPARRSVPQLLEAFDSPLPVRRVEAQEELIRRGFSVTSALRAALAKPKMPEGRQTWTAWTLGRIAERDAAGDAWFERQAIGPKVPLNLRLQSIRIVAHRRAARQAPEPLPAAIVSLLADGEPRIRFEAVHAMGRVPVAAGRLAVPALLEALARETDPTVFYGGWQTLRVLKESGALRPFLADARPGVRRAALLALLEDHALPEPDVRRLATDTDPAVQGIAARWIEKATGQGLSLMVRGRPLGGASGDLNGTSDLGTEPKHLYPAKMSMPAPPNQETSLALALERFQDGDPRRGAWLFHHPQGAGCFQCHRLDGHGQSFGPDLSVVGARTPVQHLVQSILEPNAVITEGFSLHRIETADTELSGILIEESGLSVTLGLANGRRETIQKSQITTRGSSAQSAMPAYDTVLPARAVADVAAYLVRQQSNSQAGSPGSEPPSGTAGPSATPLDGDALTFAELSGRLRLTRGGFPVADFVHQDERILRPHFANLHAPGGLRVSRNHPPRPPLDAVDHDTMHPGLWLAFGDINGVDFWRNRGRIVHRGFARRPEVRDGRLTFATDNQLVDAQGTVIGDLRHRITCIAQPGATVLLWEATFRSDVGDLVFGDQEEMGFAARVATPLTEKNGGLLTSSEGRTSAAATWGRAAAWCDYSGTVDGHRLGIQLVADASNFRPNWWHNRDYGVFVANPFGREAMKQGTKSRVTVARGEPFTLRYGAILHADSTTPPEARARWCIPPPEKR
jgi:putative membrane-bound dehydrogenase-like protein